MKILIPGDFTIKSSIGTGDTGFILADAIKSFQTYKSTSINGTGHIQLSRIFFGVAALFEGGATLPASVEVPPNKPKKWPAWYSKTDTVSWTSGQDALINVSAGTVHDFPDLPASSFTPSTPETKYINNISGMGELVGRSIVRQSSTVSLEPMSFACDRSRFAELETIRDAMRETPFYVLVDTPAGAIPYYGWTESEPQISYNGDMTQAVFSFSMRCPA